MPETTVEDEESLNSWEEDTSSESSDSDDSSNDSSTYVKETEESPESPDSELVSSWHELGDSSSSTASLALRFPHAWVKSSI